MFRFISLCLVAPVVGAAGSDLESLPVPPEESTGLIHVPEGFEVELVVAEPDVIDPVAFTWGPDGRLWVAEMTDYPLGMDGEGEPGGRVRWLKDNDGDGRYDESVVFADGLSFPNGALPWKNGVLVTAAPAILYLEDTDGDGVADERHALFEGFHEGNQQLRVNGLIRGLDNWVYCASGAHRAGYGGDSRIVSSKTGEEIALGSRDFRFRPETGELDPQSGPSQFGRNRDDWGNWYGEMNSYPVWHYVLRDHYLRRNPHFAAPDTRKQLALPRNPKVYPFKELQKRFHNFQETGRFTAACGAMVYRDGILFPESDLYTIDIFTCEPFGNLVQHNRSFPEGVSFTVSENGPVELDDGVDFFASKDRWCRPVMARTGPDGALWIADMYRYMIEHPQFLPQAGKDELESFYRAGDDRGRIYRVYRTGQKPNPIQNLDTKTSHELVDVLESRNGWQRDTAQALLVERKERSAVPSLIRLATEGVQPLARLHALCSLDGMEALDAGLLERALRDPSPGVRRHAVRLAEPFVEDHPDLGNAVLRLASDEDAKVRMQLAYSLGEWRGEPAATALGRLAFADGTDSFMAAAILSSVRNDSLKPLLESFLAESARANKGGELLGPLLALTIAFGNEEAMMGALKATLERGSDRGWQYRSVAQLLDALDRQGPSDRKHGDPAGRVIGSVGALLESARNDCQNDALPVDRRIAAVRLMGREGDTRRSDIRVLGSILASPAPFELKAEVVAHLGTMTGDEVSGVLLSGWDNYTDAIRSETLIVIATRADWIRSLLDEIESKRIADTDLDAGTRQLLITHSDEGIRSRAKELMPTANVNRLRTVRQYEAALKLKSDKGRGKAVFQDTCIACHRLDGTGLEIGPNLAALTDRSPESLLSGILDPNAIIEAKYRSYVANLKDGRAILGILVSETDTSVILKDLANQEHVILRSALESLQDTGKSLMPDGLETSLTQQDVADLIAYVAEAE